MDKMTGMVKTKQKDFIDAVPIMSCQDTIPFRNMILYAYLKHTLIHQF